MDLLKIPKFIVFLVSFAMFCYQLKIATTNLMDPPTVLSQYERDATDEDMPLITVCPTHQTNLTRLRELGYNDREDYSPYDNMLMGVAECNEKTGCTSWGSHRNLTFDEITKQVFKLNKVKSINVRKGKFKDSTVFIPGFGLCQDTSILNYTQEIVLNHMNEDDAMVFITNRNYRSFTMPDFASHVGMKIFMKPDKEHFINVNINERDNCKDDEIPTSEEDYKKCVDDKIQNDFEKNNISCVPPWLSYNKQCNQTYTFPNYFYGKFWDDFKRNYFYKLVSFKKNIRSEEECRQSCKEKTYFVDEEGSKNHFHSWADLTFNKKVIVTEKLPNYDLFKYIIDVGSSLGLWLGLSVFGLHDLVVWAVQFVNNSFMIKKIGSAVTK